MDINNMGKPPGTKKYVDTPVGKFEIPQGTADALGRMSNIELMREYVEKCRNFIDPFLFQEMADRGLIRRGDYHRDIEARLLEMEQSEALSPHNNGGLTNMSIYNEKGFADRNEYLKALAEKHKLDLIDVHIYADVMGPDEEFTGLPRFCEKEAIRLANAPDPYRARYYNGQADYFNTLATITGFPIETIEKIAAKLEPTDHFDKLVDRLQEVHDNIYGSDEQEGGQGDEPANEPDTYQARGYNDQTDYFSTLASEFALPVDMVEKMAADLETADHFDGLLAHLQETHDNVYGKMYEEAEYSLEDEIDEGMEP